MSVDKFGRFSKRARLSASSEAQGFKLTADGDFDVENKRIKNLENPTENHDAINKRYIDNQMKTLETFVMETIENSVDNLKKKIEATTKFCETSGGELRTALSNLNETLNQLNTSFDMLQKKVEQGNIELQHLKSLTANDHEELTKRVDAHDVIDELIKRVNAYDTVFYKLSNEQAASDRRAT